MKRLLVILALILTPLGAVIAQESPFAKADGLFTSRDNLDSLKQAVALAEAQRTKEPANFEIVYRVAQYKYYLADREPDKAKRLKLYEAAIEAAKRAVAIDPNRVEGHFWLAANEGEYADLKGALNALGLVKSVRKEFEAALAIDPTYKNGAIYLALGRIDLELPRLFGGNDSRGLARLEAGYQAAPTNAELKMTLAETYEKKGRKDDARQLYQSILDSADPVRTPNELAELRTKARQHLEKMK
ncbi:MAG TPA: TRAP transporter TatT component family protein [Blastocatellia bacterium]|nr:TRAP transporter TatT component family protein [Blastocatellia bacterium]